LPEAIAEEKTALRPHADDAAGWNNLEVFEARLGQTEAARYDFQQALSIMSAGVKIGHRTPRERCFAAE
jgi:Flp pilus assembly protein TadD